MEHAAHSDHSSQAGTDAPASVGPYNINFQVGGPPTAGEPSNLSFVITEQRVGEPLDEFEPLHDRLMHLIIVDESLAYFEHVHPSLQAGSFKQAHAFPSSGQYKLWAEAKPKGGEPVLAGFRLTVGTGLSERIGTRSESSTDYRVSLHPSGNAPLHQTVELTFDIADSDGRPVVDLEPLMAAGGHCVIISSDLRDFLHVHPAQDVDLGWRGGPQVKFSNELSKTRSLQNLGAVSA